MLGEKKEGEVREKKRVRRARSSEAKQARIYTKMYKQKREKREARSQRCRGCPSSLPLSPTPLDISLSLSSVITSFSVIEKRMQCMYQEDISSNPPPDPLLFPSFSLALIKCPFFICFFCFFFQAEHFCRATNPFSMFVISFSGK